MQAFLDYLRARRYAANLSSLGQIPPRGFINNNGTCFTHGGPFVLSRNLPTRGRTLQFGLDSANRRQAELCGLTQQLVPNTPGVQPESSQNGIDGSSYREAFGFNHVGNLAGGFPDEAYLQILRQASDEELARLTTSGLIWGRCPIDSHNTPRHRPAIYTPVLTMTQFFYPGQAFREYWSPPNEGVNSEVVCPVRGCTNKLDTSVPYVRRDDLPQVIMLRPGVGGRAQSSHVPLEFHIPETNIIPNYDGDSRRGGQSYFTAVLGLCNPTRTHAMTGILHSDFQLGDSGYSTVTRTRYDNNLHLDQLDRRTLGPANLRDMTYIEDHVHCLWIFASPSPSS